MTRRAAGKGDSMSQMCSWPTSWIQFAGQSTGDPSGAIFAWIFPVGAGRVARLCQVVGAGLLRASGDAYD
jgi:hypothetical protein